VTLISSSRSIP